MPAGSTRTFVVKLSITVSELLFPPRPAKEPSAPNFELTLKPLIVPFASLIGPVITSLSVGPAIARFASSVPVVSAEPDGSVTPTAGNTPSRSGTDIPCPFIFNCTVGVSPAML